MKALLVTSEITYVPRNYYDVFESTLAGAADHVFGLLVLRNSGLSLVKKGLGLFFLGAPRLGSVLIRNIVCAPLKQREALFRTRGLPVCYARNANEPAIIDMIVHEEIDLVVNMRTRCIFQMPLLTAPRLGCINIHHGLLPDDRGTMCDLFALASGRPAGFSIHAMSEKLDDGRILFRKEVSMPGEKDYAAYLSRTGREEGNSLALLLRDISKRDALPEGLPNISDHAEYSKTPATRAAVAGLKQKGISL